MSNENLVTAVDFCSYHQVEVSFIETLSEFGLIHTKVISQQVFIVPDELEKLEKIMTLHNQLDINLEGIEAIGHLLNKIEDLQDEVLRLKNRLRIYE